MKYYSVKPFCVLLFNVSSIKITEISKFVKAILFQIFKPLVHVMYFSLPYGYEVRGLTCHVLGVLFTSCG